MRAVLYFPKNPDGDRRLLGSGKNWRRNGRFFREKKWLQISLNLPNDFFWEKLQFFTASLILLQSPFFLFLHFALGTWPVPKPVYVPMIGLNQRILAENPIFCSRHPTVIKCGVCCPMCDNHFTHWTHHNISFRYRAKAVWARESVFFYKSLPATTVRPCLSLTALACSTRAY